MKQLFRHIFPPVFFESPEYFRALTLGVLYLLMLVSQLFAFERMYSIVLAYGLPGSTVMATVVTALIPLLEVAALPFLFSMLVSKRVWQWSRAAAVAAPLLWVAIVGFIGISSHHLAQVGMFGAKAPLHFGWWVLILALSILVSAVIVVRELPRRKS